jgi:hypothetical protein
MNETPDVTRQHFSTNQLIKNFDYSALDYSASHLLLIHTYGTAILKMSSRLSQFVKFYNANFERRPIPTLMITNSTLNTLADILAQSSQIYVSLSPNVANISSQQQMLSPYTTPRGHYDSQCLELLWDLSLGNG